MHDLLFTRKTATYYTVWGREGVTARAVSIRHPEYQIAIAVFL